MSETFTASNGGKVELEGGRLYIPQGYLCEPDITALREFFQHERDQELGRWRDPENPNYVAYPHEGTVVVLHEATGARMSWTRGEAEQKIYGEMLGFVTANRYFEAHPEPKPWHEAAAHDVWVLNAYGGEFPYQVLVDVEDTKWFYSAHRDSTPIALDDPDIESARRIWPPEGADD